MGGDVCYKLKRQILDMKKPFHLAIIQRVCTSYRVHLFEILASMPGLQLRLFVGEDIAGSKVRNASDFKGLDVVQLPTRQWGLGNRVLVYHSSLRKRLEEFQPDGILCEGESNILNAIEAIGFRWRHPLVGMAHWSLGGLPGVQKARTGVRSAARALFRRQFDSFVVYSSYGQRVLQDQGFPAETIFVATNVSDTTYHLQQAETVNLSKSDARARLALPDKFTVIYVGSLDSNKRIDVLIEAASRLGAEKINIVVCGDGDVLPDLKRLAETRQAMNVHFAGRVSTELPLYYRASDALIVPGRGGMVISEAMAFGLPVIVYQADGTECDLVQDGVTGIRLQRGYAEDFRHAILGLKSNPGWGEEMGRNGQRLIRERFTPENMAKQIVVAVECAHEQRRQLYGVQ